MPRSREFDRDAVLMAAMELFWQKGYEATSIQNLVDQMGINRFSLYHTFESKERLFLETLDLYCEEMAGQGLRLLQEGVGLSAIRRFFEVSLQAYLAQTKPRGCLMVNSAIEVAPHNERVAQRAKAHRERQEAAFQQKLEEAIELGELGSEENVEDLACFLTGAAFGLAALSKTLPTRATLEGHVRTVLSVLERRAG